MEKRALFETKRKIEQSNLHGIFLVKGLTRNDLRRLAELLKVPIVGIVADDKGRLFFQYKSVKYTQKGGEIEIERIIKDELGDYDVSDIYAVSHRYRPDALINSKEILFSILSQKSTLVKLYPILLDISIFDKRLTNCDGSQFVLGVNVNE